MAEQSHPTIQFIGNATTLIRIGGLTILTDPNFVHAGESVPLGYGLSAKRLTDPAIEIEDLPPLDLVLLSHYHGDHFDQVAEAKLDRMLPIVTTPQAAGTLQDLGFRVARGLETWESFEPAAQNGRVRITSLPGRHAPGVLQIALPDVMGSLIESWSLDAPGDSQPTTRLYISGDTLMYVGIAEIAERVPAIDTAVLHLGGTRVMGITVTMDAEQGVEAVRTLRPERVVPIHYDDYDVFESPLEDFIAAARDAGLGDQLRVIRRGETLVLDSGRVPTLEEDAIDGSTPVGDRAVHGVM
jgi:L-ascorbate metabolism protein UlaG (beta-lactamase superfamily)